MEKLKQIGNFFQYTVSLAAGGQPTPEQFNYLYEAGFQVIINISPASARNALHTEHLMVENLKMDYIHFPVDCSNLRDTHYLTVKALLNSFNERKVFIHCGGNIKTSNLIHMYHVLEKKVDEMESLQTLLKIQKPEAKWFSYFKKMGMKGIENLHNNYFN
jgi:protein tyrosine phosphatase (PTP) superfamily phosphohydrolase (DUF442 family)